ncbi:PqqD family protein [Paraconexibacter sp.]|uniref:PqqD family protein n=1 Tax=Paraconexibacter sp. TaxID=2949640 RepID=UPI00356722FE
MELRTQDVTWRRSGEEVVILDLRSSEYLALNASGALLWERLAQGSAEPDALNAVLVERYGIDPRTAENDVQAFVELLRTHDLVVA